MKKTPPYEKFAARFAVSRESARYYLGRVQKSFKTVIPPHQAIFDFILAKNLRTLIEPYDLAEMMFEAGAWAHELNAPPAVLLDEPDLPQPE